MTPEPTGQCSYRECGESLLADAYQDPWGARYCDEQHALLELVAQAFDELPNLHRVEDVKKLAYKVLREARWFALGVEPDRRPPPPPEDEEE